MSGNATYLAQQTAGMGYLQQANNAMFTGQLQARGYFMEASGYRASSTAVGQAAEFNQGVDNINLQRQLENNNRQAQRVLGQQISQTAVSGITGTSKSALAIRNETVDLFARESLSMRLDFENNRRSKAYETAITQMNLENKARAADYQGQSTQAITNIKVGAYQQQANAAFSIGRASLLNSMLNRR